MFLPLQQKTKPQITPKVAAPKGSRGAIGKPPRRLRRGEIPAQQYRNRLILFPNSPAPSACAFSALASGRSI